MAYEPVNWKNRVVERPRTYHIQNNPDGTVTLIPAPGQVYEEGTPVDALHLNKMEQGLVTHLADVATAHGGVDATSILTKLKTVDGAGSGLDADLLDGKQASSFLTTVTGSGTWPALTLSSTEIRYVNLGVIPKFIVVYGDGGTSLYRKTVLVASYDGARTYTMVSNYIEADYVRIEFTLNGSQIEIRYSPRNEGPRTSISGTLYYMMFV